MNTSDTLISHGNLNDLQQDLNAHRDRLKNTDNLTLPLGETLALLDDTQTFELGRFLLKNRGLNGYWTSYAILEAPKQSLHNPLEHWLIHEAPVIRATRERFYKFQKILQEHLQNPMHLASLPCGMMDDLLLLKLPTTHDGIVFTGIDLDADSLTQAQHRAQQANKTHLCHFIQKSAWDIDLENTFDMLVSNGLNIYEPDDLRVIDFYRLCHRALKPGGKFLMSFLTPPPTADPASPWKNFQLKGILKQKAIMADIFQARWQCFRSEEKTRQQLETAGFAVEAILYDNQAMFPTVLATKRR